MLCNNCLPLLPFQSTHPCGVRLFSLLPTYFVDNVSIHAPLRGATDRPRYHRVQSSRFNPRTPAGCDRVRVDPGAEAHQFQSTHPCGVRPAPEIAKYLGRTFQSTHLCGVRPRIVFPRRFGMEFQSTHPCGVRRGPWWPLSTLAGFNPRTPAGCDLETQNLMAVYEAFQSTHPCGVRLSFPGKVVRSPRFQSTHPCGVRQEGGIAREGEQDVSIHAPLRGATDTQTASCYYIVVSIHAPLRGATNKQAADEVRMVVSIHAPLRGATSSRTSSSTIRFSFNPRTPARCDF